MGMDDFAYYSPPPPEYYPTESTFLHQYPPYQPYYPPQASHYPPQNQHYAPPQPYYPPPSPYFSPESSPYDPPSPYSPPSNQQCYPPPYYSPPQCLSQQVLSPQQEPLALPPLSQDLLAAVILQRKAQAATTERLKNLEMELERMFDAVNQMQQSAQMGELPTEELQQTSAQAVTILNTPQILHPTETPPLPLQEGLQSQGLTAKPSEPSQPLTVSVEKQAAMDEVEHQLHESKQTDPEGVELEMVLDVEKEDSGLMDLRAEVKLKSHFVFEHTSSKDIKGTDIRIEEEPLLEGIDHEMLDAGSQISVGETKVSNEQNFDSLVKADEKLTVRWRIVDEFFENGMVDEFFQDVVARGDTLLYRRGIG